MKKQPKVLRSGHGQVTGGLVNYLALMHAITHPQPASEGARR